jgi:hypothetical protein
MAGCMRTPPELIFIQIFVGGLEPHPRKVPNIEEGLHSGRILTHDDSKSKLGFSNLRVYRTPIGPIELPAKQADVKISLRKRDSARRLRDQARAFRFANMSFSRITLLGALFFLVAPSSQAQVSWLTRSSDNARSGANLLETALTIGNVRSATFGKLFERVIDGQVYAQPLYVPGLSIPGKGTHNVVVVATMNDSVYAFDADDPAASAPLWKRSFLSTGVTPVPFAEVAGTKDAYPVIGVVGTPVIKPDGVGGGTIYVTAKTKEVSGTTTNYFYRLHALDLLTGAEKSGSPVVIRPSVPGTSSDSVNGVLTFNAKKHMQRPGLLLLNNIVYAAFASHADRLPYHGWVIGYNADTLAQVAVFCTTPNAQYGGIWEAGQGLASDASGNIYAITGNAVFNVAQSSYGDSFLKLSTTNGLSLVDSFTPYNESALNSADLDLGSSGAVLVPGTNLLLGGGKQGILYVLNRSSLGGHQTSDDSQIVQSWTAGKGHIHGSPVFWNSSSGLLMYVWSEYDKLKAFQFSGNTFVTTPAFQSAMAAPPGMPGASLTVSANGSVNGSGIVWASLPLAGDANQSTVRGVLRAFDASNLNEIWNSRQYAARDDLGWHAKFNPPTVVNGKVFVCSFGSDDGSDPAKLVCYGLLPTPTSVPPAPMGLSASPGTGQVWLNWTGSLTASSYKVLRGNTPAGPYSVVKSGVTSCTAIDSGLSNGSTYYYVVTANNSVGDSLISNEAAATPGSLTAVYRVNSGSGTFAPFAADSGFSGGSQRTNTTPVDISGVMDPAPTDVYRSERYGTFSYTFGSLIPGGTYLVRLHLAETDWYLPGQRMIDVSINGTKVLSGFDILGETGGPFNACVQEFAGQANGSGQIVISFAPSGNSPDRNARSGGLEILTASSSIPGAANLAASPGDSLVNLHWNLVPGAQTYDVYRSLSSGTETLRAPGVSGASYVDSGCTNGTKYFYEIRAVGAGGAGPTSDEASATPSPATGFSLSASPTSVSASPGGTGNATITVTGANGFSGVVGLSVNGLPVGVAGSFAPTTISTSGSSMLTLTVGSGVAPGDYPLMVVGTSNGLNASAPLTLTVSDLALVPPSTVTAAGGNTQIFLNWTAVAGANSYNIRRSTKSNGPFDVVGSGSSLSFTDTALTNGTRYYYAITSANDGGESGLSTVVSAIPRAHLAISMTADTYVQAGSSANLNFGTAGVLQIKRVSNTGTNGLNRCTFLTLDLSNVTSAPSSASLTFHIDGTSTPRTSTPTIQLYQIPSMSWGETTITWANAPGLNQSTFASTGTLVGSGAVTLGSSYFSFDVTAFVAANLGKVVTLQLIDPNIDSVLTAFSSRESTTAPVLNVTWPAPLSLVARRTILR